VDRRAINVSVQRSKSYQRGCLNMNNEKRLCHACAAEFTEQMKNGGNLWLFVGECVHGNSCFVLGEQSEFLLQIKRF